MASVGMDEPELMGVTGYYVDRVSPRTLRRLRRGQPTSITLGRGAWGQIRVVAEPIGNRHIFLRDVEEQGSPEDMADRMIAVAEANPDLNCYGYAYNEQGINSKAARARYVKKELRFIRRCHAYGLPVIALNTSWGTPGKTTGPATDTDVREAMEELRPIHGEADLVGGPHLYDIFDHEVGQWVDPRYSVFQYRRYPAWFDRSKYWPTEWGVDSIGRPEGLPDSLSPGWHTFTTPKIVEQRLARHLAEWRADGLAGLVYFALDTLDGEWVPYYPTDRMIDTWAAMAPFASGGGISMPTEKERWIAEAGGMDAVADKEWNRHDQGLHPDTATYETIKGLASLMHQARLLLESPRLTYLERASVAPPSVLRMLAALQRGLDSLPFA